MAVTKTNFLNYSRCPRYVALAQIKKERLEADISYEEYLNEELTVKLSELLNGMYEVDENGETDLIDVPNRQLEVMLKYYKKVEDIAGILAQKQFGGKTIFSESTKKQECFDFSSNGIRYLCYVDIYNENEKGKNIIEVKATTTNKFFSLSATGKDKEKHSIFQKIGNILYLKDELPDFEIKREIEVTKYTNQRAKLFNRYKEGRYVYDLAVQRFIIENEHKQSGNEKELENIRYYLAVLNHEYVFDGTYVDNEPIYNPDASGNEIITFIDLTNVTKELQPLIEQDKQRIENYIFTLDAKPCLLGPSCDYKKQTVCKFFDKICANNIPKSNSSLNYLDNGFGFDTGNNRMKSLDLINNGYLDLLDIPEEWIKRENHHIQRNAYRTKTPFIDREKIKDILKLIEYPIYHLDFETFPCPLPRFKGEKAYYQSPFEFSLHIERKPGICDKDKDNYVFLADSYEDQREELIKRLLEVINPNKGTLFAQNITFEKSRIKELADIFPKYQKDLMKIYNRGFDLIWILKTKSDLYKELGYDEETAKRINYYDYRFSGSYSIKKTLPVFSDLRYDNLEVKNGTDAIIEYAKYPSMSKEEFEIKYKALIEYCKQDTWAMVVILDALRNCVKNASNIM